MSEKMDRIGARTPADLERKYGKYGKMVYENERQVKEKVPQTTFEAFAEAVAKELGNKVGADEVAEALNNAADSVNLESDAMKIINSGFELRDGEAMVKKGLVSCWVVEYDEILQAVIMRSPESVYGRVWWTLEQGAAQSVGYVFFALAPRGLMYVVKAESDYSSDTRALKYFYEATFEPQEEP